VPSTPEFYDNFEFGLDFGPTWCCPPTGCWGLPCSAKIEWSTDYAVSGAHSLKIKSIRNNSPGASWSAWASLDGCMMVPPITSFPTAQYLKVYMRSSVPITMRFHWYESFPGAPVGSEDWYHEEYVPGGSGTAGPSGGWTSYSWNLATDFTTDCPPSGDGIPSPGFVGGLWFDFVTQSGVACGPGTTMTWPGYADLYIDDIRFSATP
jgi:hypothetical protein